MLLFFVNAYLSDSPAQAATKTHPPFLKPVVITTLPAKGSNETNISDPQNKTSEWLLYEDKDLGFSIKYPEDWTKKTDGLPGYTVVYFYAPTVDVAVQVNFKPLNADQDLSDMARVIKNERSFVITKYYSNETTKLAGLPAIMAIGTEFFDVSETEKALGIETSHYKVLSISTVSKLNQASYDIGYFADKSNFDEYQPIAEQMIDSFQIFDFKNNRG
jgi:hypothetical protein